jgi:hypothetical protein
MESWSEKGAKFKSGGTLYVRQFESNANAGSPSSSGGSAVIVGTTEMKEIPYGFEIKTKGGLVDGKSVDVDFDFAMSGVTKTDDSAGYDRHEEISQQKIVCPIGKTTLISGFKSLVDERTSPSGLPVLRNTPLLNWFLADSGYDIVDRRLIIMVCPEIVDNSQDGNLKVDEEINIPVKTEGVKTTAQREEERKPFKGFWYWMNWFVW